MVFLEDFEHLVLPNHLAQLVGMGRGGQSQQQSIVVFLHAKEVQLSGVGEQGAVIIVVIALNLVIGGVEASQALHQLYLALLAALRESLYRLFRGALVPYHGYMGVDDVVHLLSDVVDIECREGAADVQIAVIAVAHGDVYDHLALGKQFVDGPAQHEEQGACVCPHARGGVQIQKLHVLGVIHVIGHALHLVVHLGTNRTEVHLQLCPFIDFLQCASCGYLQCFAVVLAADVHHVFHHSLDFC